MSDPSPRERLTLELLALSTYLGAQVEDERVRMYVADLLDDYELDRVIETVHRMRKRLIYFPKMKEIIDEIEGTELDRAYLAWVDLRNITGPQPYHLPALDNPVVFKCFQAMGGPAGFGAWPYSQEDFKVKRFAELFLLYSRELRTNPAKAIDWTEGDEKAKALLDKLRAPKPKHLPRPDPGERPPELRELVQDLKDKADGMDP